MEVSIFAKIIRGDIPSYKIYEDELVFAFLDIHPVMPGHTLVVPKKQVQFVWDLDAADYEAVMRAAKHIALHLRERAEQPYVAQRIVGTDVPHAHVHLIPFSDSSQLHHRPDLHAEPDHKALSELAKRLAME
jgi:histidine triad (HIT) family protein